MEDVMVAKVRSLGEKFEIYASLALFIPITACGLFGMFGGILGF